MTQIPFLENLEPSRKQCNSCQLWFDKTTFPQRSGRCKECYRAGARERSRSPEQVQKRQDRRANFTPEQREAERERGRRNYANRTPEQKQRVDELRDDRKEIDNARARELRAQSPERRARQTSSVWKSKLKNLYGITPEIHRIIYEDQGGRCYFCDVHLSSRGCNGLVIDHDKDTGFVRGLLCRHCNANFADEYKKLPEQSQDSPRANAYLLRGRTGDYIESIKLGNPCVGIGHRP